MKTRSVNKRMNNKIGLASLWLPVLKGRGNRTLGRINKIEKVQNNNMNFKAVFIY
jgi:hypothetical protein